ncbi:MAG: adenine phosphoribosyltransferase [Lachnospiraceae bacterium]|nr:adenine phosphoribosyltransferase [Lachnospiraceae bacterium]
MIKEKVEDYIRTIPDFPQKGVMFRDITTVLSDADGLKMAIDEMAKLLEGVEFDVLAGAESRGFIFGTALAYNLHKPLVLIRKKGKLPGETVSQEYSLEYGTATIEMHKDSVKPGQKVVLVDDLIATGGTIEASAKLVEKLGGEVVKMIFLLELEGLNGHKMLEEKGYSVGSVVTYPGK